jgi:dTDP-4-dehydrorhamnose 3,5-epimerase
MPFIFEKQTIPDVVLITPAVFGDERGYFMETFKESDFTRENIAVDFLQDNQSVSKKGTLRGLHFQHAPHAQGKLVRVVTGSVFDVAVDIRPHSPTFKHWVGRTLTATNKHMLWIPPGFAHGVLTLEDNTTLLYKCSGEYQPSMEGCLAWNDADINIAWPLHLTGTPLLSDKDACAPKLADALH